MRRKRLIVILRFPAWASRLYIFLGLVLVPWTVYIALTLPKHHFTSNWDVSWTGLNIGLILSLVCTGLLAWRKSIWLVITSTITGSFLLIDAWFDVMGEHKAVLFQQAILLAVLFEIPLAIMSFYLAVHTIKHNYQPAKK